MAASDFICEGVDKSPVCPGYLSRSIRPSADLVQLSVLPKTTPGVGTCPSSDTTTSYPTPPCPSSVCKRTCPFADPCSPCYRTAHERRNPPPRFDPCAAFRCDPCYPAVNCAPNLPFPVLAPWRPAPPAVRLSSTAQLPSKPCPPAGSVPCNPCPLPLACERPCPARCLPVPPRGGTLSVKKPVVYSKGRACNPAPPIPVYTCSTIGTRKTNDRISTYYNYSGYLDVPGASDARCLPVIPCHLYSNYVYAGCSRKPIVWKTATVVPPNRHHSVKREQTNPISVE